MNALYKSLNPAEKSFVDSKTISATYKIRRWLNLLVKAARIDKKIEAKINKLMGWGILFIILAIVSFVLIFIFSNLNSVADSEGIKGLGVIICSSLTVIFIALAVASFVKKGKLKSKDINDYLRKFFLPVLNILQDKAGEEAKLAATLDFRIPRKELEPQNGKVGVRSVKSYNPNYIRSKVQMKDGTTLEFSVADRIQDFSWKKRSASGKTKYKSKTKFVHQCLIKMTLPKSVYEVKDNVEDSVLVNSHNGDYIAKHKIKLKKIGVDNMLNVAFFFEGVQTVYRQFNSLNNSSKRIGESDDDEERTYTSYDDGVDVGDVALAYMWMDTDFDNYDYDSFDYAEGGDFSMDDDSATVFDS